MPQIGDAPVLLKCALVIQMGSKAQPAIGSLAGAFADSAAGADIVEQNRIILNRELSRMDWTELLGTISHSHRIMSSGFCFSSQVLGESPGSIHSQFKVDGRGSCRVRQGASIFRRAQI